VPAAAFLANKYFQIEQPAAAYRYLFFPGTDGGSPDRNVPRFPGGIKK
jgi:hypothetical protein